MESDLNDKEESFIETADTLTWTSNPLYKNNGTFETGFIFNKQFATDINIINDENSPRINNEFETESGFSESVSLYSFSSSPDLSLTPNTIYSDADEEVDLLHEITEEMLKANFITSLDGDKACLSENASQIISSKGTVRGVRNRVRDNILHFCSPRIESKNNNEVKKDNTENGKVLIYTTSLGLVRSTQDDCRYVRRIFHSLMVRCDERDLFVHPFFKTELQDRLAGGKITLPQVFVNGTLIGGAKEVERLIETGEMQQVLQGVQVSIEKFYLKKTMLWRVPKYDNEKKILPGRKNRKKAPDPAIPFGNVVQVHKVSHSEVCPTCGGYRFVNCSKCSGSGKSRKTRISREINRLKCSSCTNGIITCPECNS